MFVKEHESIKVNGGIGIGLLLYLCSKPLSLVFHVIDYMEYWTVVEGTSPIP